MRFYFDYNASTPLAPAVKDIITKACEQDLMNPSSTHWEGRQARDQIEAVREAMAKLVGCQTSEITFTSGATEAHNLLFKSLWASRSPEKNTIITTAVEHDSVLAPLRELEKMGANLKILPVNQGGQINLADFKEALDESVLLLSVMMVNNETGILFPIKNLAHALKGKDILFHVDAACALGKLEVDFKDLGVDFLTFSGHKFYVPKGVGGMITRKGSLNIPLSHGGPHEQGVRAGTENLIGILGLASGLQFALENLTDENIRLESFRARIKESLSTFPCVLHESLENQLPGTLNIAFKDVEGRTLLTRLDLEGIAASHGSACQSGSLDVSHVLLGMGISEEEARSSIRLSFGKMTTDEDVKGMLDVLQRVLNYYGNKK